jgi:hypothetical protein
MPRHILDAILDGPHRARGATISAEIPLSERVLNQLASSSGGRVFDIRVVGPSRITATARGPFGIPLPIDATIVRVDANLELTVQFNGFAGKALSLVAGLVPQARRDGAGRLRVAIADLPQVAPYRAYLRYLRSVVIGSRPGVLLVNLEAALIE